MPALLCEPDPQPSFGWLRSNFAENLSVLDAMVAMRRDYQEKAWVWGRFGAATLWARAATVFKPKRKPGSKAKSLELVFLCMPMMKSAQTACPAPTASIT